MSRTTVDIMEALEIGIRKIEDLLKNVDHTKAASPDGISPKVLKRCKGETALYLYLIYTSSLSTGKLPVIGN